MLYGQPHEEMHYFICCVGTSLQLRGPAISFKSPPSFLRGPTNLVVFFYPEKSQIGIRPGTKHRFGHSKLDEAMQNVLSLVVIFLYIVG